MMIDVPVRHTDSDKNSDDEALPSIVVAAMENLIVLFSELRVRATSARTSTLRHSVMSVVLPR